MTASSLRPASHFSRSMGATTSASWRFCRLRHLLPLSSRSLMAMSVRPRSLRFATTFDPMNPAPPVTSSIGPLHAACRFLKTAPSFAPVRTPAQYRPAGRSRRNPDTIRGARFCDEQRPSSRLFGLDRVRRSGYRLPGMSTLSQAADSPILIVPYMWIGDFVRCHSVVKLLKARFPARPVDLLATHLCAPLLDYMPGVRQGIVWDLPRGRLAVARHHALARRLRAEHYGTALIMPRTWKSALAPFLAGIPERIGFFGELRFGLLSDVRWGERALPRMVDRCASLALPRGAPLPSQWPEPKLVVPDAELADWRSKDLRLRSWAVPTRSRWRPRSRQAPATKCATLPGPTCATRSWRSRPRRRRCRTIPGCCTSPPRSARPRSGFSGRRARGTGPRSIRLPPPSRPQPSSIAVLATSRPAGSATTAACATSIPSKCS